MPSLLPQLPASPKPPWIRRRTSCTPPWTASAPERSRAKETAVPRVPASRSRPEERERDYRDAS